MIGKRIIAGAFLALGLSGCSGSFGTMDGIMSSWQGAHIREVVSQWGYPHEERSFDGTKIYIWHHNTSMVMPSTTYSTGTITGNTVRVVSTSTGGYASSFNCQRILEVNPKGYVTSWQWAGNNCPFMEAMEYSTWRRKAAPPESMGAGDTLDSSETQTSDISVAVSRYDYAKILQSPDLNSPQVQPLSKGDRLKVFRENSNWYEVGTGDTPSGWVAKKWVRPKN